MNKFYFIFITLLAFSFANSAENSLDKVNSCDAKLYQEAHRFIKPNITGEFWEWKDPDSFAHIKAGYFMGTLRFQIRTRKSNGAPFNDKVRAADLFDLMMSEFQEQGINTIVGNWNLKFSDGAYDTNLKQYWHAREILGLSRRDAAASTWTGKQLARYGYVPISRISERRAERITVAFEKASNSDEVLDD